MNSQVTQKYKVKLIKLSDTYIDNSREFPFIHRVSSNIRFRLRSKIIYDHEPVLLIEKLNSFDYILPMTQEFDLSSRACQQNFICLRGKNDPDGAWYVELPDKVPGIVSFQVAFVPYGTTKATRYGTHDVVFLTRQDNQLRKLRKQTVFPRCIGKYKEWTNYLLRQMDLGYNSFHFAPIQQTGNSKSYYSLKDHLDLSDDLFHGTKQQKKQQLIEILTDLKKKGVVFFIDIVLNHCSFDAQWIKDHSDAVYTPENTPVLRPAFEVDDIIYRWGNEIKSLFSSGYEGQKLQFNEQFVKEIEQNLRKALYDLSIEEYFILSEQVEKTLLATVAPRKPSENLFAKDPIELIENFIQANICDQCTQKRQVKLKNIGKWKELNIAYEISDLKMAINYYNAKWIKKIKEEWIPEIVINTINEVRHNYLHNDYRDFEDPYPFVSKYFSRIPKSNKDPDSPRQCFWALNNGWVGGADSRQNFALSKQFYYLRRRVNIWGDLIRIRYGDKPSDSPYAWEYMKNYVQEMANIFDGFRLDNCHGTQLNVARYMVKQARLANPNVIIFAELFTNNDEQKALFVRSIGINAVLKEAQHMLSGSSFIHNIYDSLGKGATYVGGLNRYMEERNELIKYSTRKKPILLVYDMTHDNMTYCEKKIQVLQTPVTVLISLMGAFIGSTKGYDQFYARKVQVIESKQLYSYDYKSHPQIDKSQIQKIKFTYPADGIQTLTLYGSWNNWKHGTDMALSEENHIFWAQIEVPPGHYEYKFQKSKNNEWVTHPLKSLTPSGNHEHNLPGGEVAFKDVCNNLQSLRKEISKIADKYFRYCEYLNFHKNDIVVIIREGQDHEGSVCVIANLSTRPQKLPDGIELFGEITEADIWVQSEFTLYEGHLFNSQIVHSRNLKEYFDVAFNKEKGNNILIANQIPVGFGCVIECRKTKERVNGIRQVRDLVNRPIRLPQLNALDANMILYGSSKEEQTIYGSSNYIIPQDNNKQLVYGGFGGIFTAIKNAKKDNNLSIKLFDNLRQGNWLMDYYLGRLKRSSSLIEFADKVQKVFNSIKSLERYLIPKYFSDFVYRVCHAVEDKISNNSMSIFERKLKSASTQFINKFPNQKPGFEILFAAGLPHFATGWARSWGRDTFTSNELLLQHPQIYKLIILQYASALRHGMIPNLLDNGNNPRYNCRDACWWFIRGVKEYARKTNDYQIFKQKVNMLFLSNDMIEHNHLKKQGKTKTLTVQEIIHEIVQSHANGVYYREWRAGYEIDSNMMTEGFNIQLTVDEHTGFINGGNQLNCLTWMDKMGSSIKAGNKGYPATPRAGEPVELVGLLYHCLNNLHKLHEEGHYAFDDVIFKKRKIKYSEWALKIKQNFEKQFYIPEEKSSTSLQDLRHSQTFEESHSTQASRESKINSSYVRLRGIYKDVLKARIINEEYRLRPNALITLALAPQIINPDHARAYLANVETYLLFPNSIGVATLAQIHESLYMPYYDNSDDSTQIKSAHGFSYHNGPEWVWLYGFYVLAKINFDSHNTTKNQLLGLLQEHNNYINNNEWCSLSEMTNKNAEFNQFSCPAQAWSISSLLMAWNAIKQLPEERKQMNGAKIYKDHIKG